MITGDAPAERGGEGEAKWNRECVVCARKWEGDEFDVCPACTTYPDAVRSDLAALLKQAALHKMTPAEVRAQKRSWIRGQTGATDEQILAVLPDLAP